MAKRRNGHGPTDEDLDAADLKGTTTVVGEYDYDTPTVDEIEQAETGYPDRAIPVEIVNPVRVDELPTRSGGMFTRRIEAVPQRALLPADPQRKSATILALDIDIRVGTTQNEALSGAGAQWPVGIPLVTTLADEIWIAGLAGAAASVSVIVEHWAR